MSGVAAVDTPAGSTGELVQPGDASYDARRGWNQLYQRYPAATAYCADTPDVVAALIPAIKAQHEVHRRRVRIR